jgi:ABC-2 type transport system ATP-binding protein
MTIIKTNKLAKSFKTRQDVVQAVQGIDMCVEQGEIYGFLGPNGAGKTTTLRMLTTLLRPSSGAATVAGHDLLRQPEQVRRRIGFVSQSGGAEDSATTRENLMLQARCYGLTWAQARERCNALIEALELGDFADRIVRTLSGGQRRRLDLALGMVHQPALLFLDEPTAALDPQSRARLWDEIRNLRSGGTTVFLTTHYLDEADALCDRLAIIDHGAIVAEDTPRMLKHQIAGDIVLLGLGTGAGSARLAYELLERQPFVREVQATGDTLRLSVERGEEALPIILRELNMAALPISTIELSRPTLDDVFLRKTGRSLREQAA